MITTQPLLQVRLLDDAQVDANRRARSQWQHALDQDLRALQDYVHPGQYIIWQPSPRQQGVSGVEVHLVTETSCTCQQFKLWGRCPHHTFLSRMIAADNLPGTDVPIAAREI